MSGCYPLGFFKESSRETPIFVPKNDKMAKSCAFLSFVKNRFIGSLVRIRATHSVIARSVATWQSPGRDTE